MKHKYFPDCPCLSCQAEVERLEKERFEAARRKNWNALYNKWVNEEYLNDLDKDKGCSNQKTQDN